MGCGSCGTGKPGGCKSNGGCSSGGCNRLNTFDWLKNLPMDDKELQCKVLEVSFNNGSRKDFFRNPNLEFYEKGDLITVEGSAGFDVGEVSLTGELVRLQLKKKGVPEFHPEMKRVLRRSNDKDLEVHRFHKEKQLGILAKSRELAIKLKLKMKLTEVDVQSDGKKATFFYTADDRVDFRELIKQYNTEFRLKVEMKQIGMRQEAAKVGGIGSCGRELCCSSWLQEYKSVNTTAARYQNLSINQSKLSGQCGRLKCCLNYELDTYLDALQHFPDHVEKLYTEKGAAFLIKKDIFKNLMWYVLENSTRHFPLTIERVKQIKDLNKQNKRPEDFEIAEIVTAKSKQAEEAFVDVVGQVSLKSLEKADKKRKQKARDLKRNEEQAQNKNSNDAPVQVTNKQQPNNPKQGHQQNNNKQQAGNNQQQNTPRQPLEVKLKEQQTNAPKPQNNQPQGAIKKPQQKQQQNNNKQQTGNNQQQNTPRPPLVIKLKEQQTIAPKQEVEMPIQQVELPKQNEVVSQPKPNVQNKENGADAKEVDKTKKPYYPKRRR